MTLVTRIASPLMSWGAPARFTARYSAPDPTLSALQGMVAAGAGIGRHEKWPDWIARMNLAVRIERAGETLRDYHTINPADTDRYRWLSESDRKNVRTIVTAEGKTNTAPIQTERYYRTDAEYVVFWDDPTGNVTDALTEPKWALYAGRKQCVLTAPFLLGSHPAAAAIAAGDVPTVPLREGDDTGARTVITFNPADGATSTSTRGDRGHGHGRWTPQDRWYSNVTPPVAADWFAVTDSLKETV